MAILVQINMVFIRDINCYFYENHVNFMKAITLLFLLELKKKLSIFGFVKYLLFVITVEKRLSDPFSWNLALTILNGCYESWNVTFLYHVWMIRSVTLNSFAKLHSYIVISSINNNYLVKSTYIHILDNRYRTIKNTFPVTLIFTWGEIF